MPTIADSSDLEKLPLPANILFEIFDLLSEKPNEASPGNRDIANLIRTSRALNILYRNYYVRKFKYPATNVANDFDPALADDECLQDSSPNGDPSTQKPEKSCSASIDLAWSLSRLPLVSSLHLSECRSLRCGKLSDAMTKSGLQWTPKQADRVQELVCNGVVLRDEEIQDLARFFPKLTSLELLIPTPAIAFVGITGEGLDIILRRFAKLENLTLTMADSVALSPRSRSAHFAMTESRLRKLSLHLQCTGPEHQMFHTTSAANRELDLSPLRGLRELKSLCIMDAPLYPILTDSALSCILGSLAANANLQDLKLVECRSLSCRIAEFIPNSVRELHLGAGTAILDESSGPGLFRRLKRLSHLTVPSYSPVLTLTKCLESGADRIVHLEAGCHSPEFDLDLLLLRKMQSLETLALRWLSRPIEVIRTVLQLPRLRILSLHSASSLNRLTIQSLEISILPELVSPCLEKLILPGLLLQPMLENVTGFASFLEDNSLGSVDLQGVMASLLEPFGVLGKYVRWGEKEYTTVEGLSKIAKKLIEIRQSGLYEGQMRRIRFNVGAKASV